MSADDDDDVEALRAFDAMVRKKGAAAAAETRAVVGINVAEERKVRETVKGEKARTKVVVVRKKGGEVSVVERRRGNIRRMMFSRS